MPTSQEIEAQFRERMLTFGYEVRGPERYGIIDLRTWIVATGKLIAYGEILRQLDGPDPVLEHVDSEVVIRPWGGANQPGAYHNGRYIYDDPCDQCYDEDDDEDYECDCFDPPDDPEERAVIDRFKVHAEEVEWALSNWVSNRWMEHQQALRLADTDTTPFGDTIVPHTR